MPKKIIENRFFQLEYVDKVFAVSKNGKDYLKEKKHPTYFDKIHYSYLGSNNYSCKKKKLNRSLILALLQYQILNQLGKDYI